MSAKRGQATIVRRLAVGLEVLKLLNWGHLLQGRGPHPSTVGTLEEAMSVRENVRRVILIVDFGQYVRLDDANGRRVAEELVPVLGGLGLVGLGGRGRLLRHGRLVCRTGFYTRGEKKKRGSETGRVK